MRKPSAAPSERELSAKLTEGEILYRAVNRFAYTGKIEINIPIAEAKNGNSELIQCFGAALIRLHLFGSIVTASIQLNSKTNTGAVKIDNIVSDGFLTLKANRVGTKVFIPKLSLPRSHVFSKMFRTADIVWIIGIHYNSGFSLRLSVQ